MLSAHIIGNLLTFKYLYIIIQRSGKQSFFKASMKSVSNAMRFFNQDEAKGFEYAFALKHKLKKDHGH